MGRNSKIPDIEQKHGKTIKTILAELAPELSYMEIAAELSIGKTMVYDLLKKYGIKTKERISPTEINVNGALGKVIQGFMVTKELAGLTPSALRFYRDNLRRFCWWLSNEAKIAQDLNAVNTDTIRRFLYYIQTSNVRFGGLSTASRKPANRSTLDAYWRTFQAFTSWLVKEGYIRKDENPMDRIDRPKQLKTVIPELPEEYLRKILESFEDDFNGRRNKAMILVLLDTGMRLSELAGISLQNTCLLYTSPSPRDRTRSRMPSSA